MNDKIRQEIEDEFSQLSQNIESENPTAFKYAMNVFGVDSQKRGMFGTIFKSGGTLFNMRREPVLFDIIKYLIAKENYKDIIGEIRMTEATLVKLIRLFVDLCERKQVKCPIDLTFVAPFGLGRSSILKFETYRGPNFKLNSDDVDMIRLMLEAKQHSTYGIAKLFNISQSTVHQIKSGLTWTKKIIDLHKEGEDRARLEKKIWPGGPICPFCGSNDVNRFSNNANRFNCRVKECHRNFSVLVGTKYENTKIPMDIWDHAESILEKEPELSSIKLAQKLGISQKSAWRIIKKQVN